MKDLNLITFSEFDKFRNCRKACEYRYIRELVPIQQNPTLNFGTVIHNCLEIWHANKELDSNATYNCREQIKKTIAQSYPDRYSDPRQHADYLNALAMMVGYDYHYPEEDWNVLALEQVFSGDIVNPDTGAKSKSFILSGKIDALIEKPDGSLWLVEHKTASTLDGAYLEKLWSDLQIALYAYYIEKSMGRRVDGIIYNVLVKVTMKQDLGESQEEYIERFNALCDKNKSGKSSAVRQMPEPDQDYLERLTAKYIEEQDARFHREEIYTSKKMYTSLREELWELTQQFLIARRTGKYYRNTSYCYKWGRACEYHQICMSGDSTIVIENEFVHKSPHSELNIEASAMEESDF